MDAVKVTGGKSESIKDLSALENQVTILLNGVVVTAQVATTENLDELGAGYVITEGLCKDIKSVKTDTGTNTVYVTSDSVTENFTKIKDKTAATQTGTSGGIEYTDAAGSQKSKSLSDARVPRVIDSDLDIEIENIYRATKEIISDLWTKTGGVHCSVLFREGGEIVAVMTDVGRHNTVDKVVGSAILNGIDLSRCFLGCTGRQPYGMVKKCMNAGIPIIISKAASTADGIRLAQKSGITLICFARGERFTVYSNPQRVRGISAENAKQ
ncbi:MAG: formate dehydrogenase accessory sulfurtransferase FdhD [Methanomicrobium sp.]|nr:formate dehydrogenase accessory sulfurtransferase FdhD [Methanomicrobium sp.]